MIGISKNPNGYRLTFKRTRSRDIVGLCSALANDLRDNKCILLLFTTAAVSNEVQISQGTKTADAILPGKKPSFKARSLNFT